MKKAYFIEEKPHHFFLRGELIQCNDDYIHYHIIQALDGRRNDTNKTNDPKPYISICCDDIDYDRQNEYGKIKFETFDIFCLPYFTCKVTMPYYKVFNFKDGDCEFFIKNKDGKLLYLGYSQNFEANLYIGISSYYDFDNVVFRGGSYMPTRKSVNYVALDYATNAKIWVEFTTEYLLNNLAKFDNKDKCKLLKMAFCYNERVHFKDDGYTLIYEIIKQVGFGNIPFETRDFIKRRYLSCIKNVISYEDISKSQKSHLSKCIKKIEKLDFCDDIESESNFLSALNLIMQLPNSKYKNNYKHIISKILYYE